MNRQERYFMKILICGSRNYTDYETFKYLLEENLIREQIIDVEEVVGGNARGIDSLGEKWAQEKDIRVALFPADWYNLGKSAGPKRNTKMIEYLSQFKDIAVIAFVDSKSKGTWDTVRKAKEKNIKTVIVRLP